MPELPLAFEINTERITNFPHLPFLFTSFTMAKEYIKFAKHDYRIIRLSISSSFSVVVAAAPSNKKVFSDEFLDQLRSEIFGKPPVKDANMPNTVSSCMCFLLVQLVTFLFLIIFYSVKSNVLQSNFSYDN